MYQMHAPRQKPVAPAQQNSCSTNRKIHVNKSISTLRFGVESPLINLSHATNSHITPRQQVLQSSQACGTAPHWLDSFKLVKKQTYHVLQSHQSCFWQRCHSIVMTHFIEVQNRSTSLKTGIYGECGNNAELSVNTTRTLPRRAPLTRRSPRPNTC